MKKLKSIILLFVFSQLVVVYNSYAKQIDYSKWQTVLSSYVNSNGRVNYDILKKNRSGLDSFIDTQIKNADISMLSNNERKAFWINAYNALTMRLVVDHYSPKLKGIRKINWGRPWSIKMKAAGRSLTLSEIEHEILRKWKPFDPRIHFAINCASIGCPNLPNTYFQPEKLDEQLDNEARKFMNNQSKIKLDRSKNILYHTAILTWFKDDFLIDYPDRISLILKYINENDRKYILQNKDKIKLKEIKYEWSLNKQ